MPLNRRQTIVTLSAGLAAPFVRPSWAQARTLNITNWEGYISETAIPDFESEFAIGVVYDPYSSSEEFDAKMLAGGTGYDVVMSSGASLPLMIKVGVYHKLDRTRFKNYGNLDPVILKVLEGFDPGNQYGVPYMWGSVGFAYNLDLVKEVLPDVDLNTMEAIFLPENAAKLAGCGISLLDSPADIGFMVLKWKGIDPALAGQAELDQMIAAFDAIRPSILTFDNTNYTSRMANGEICVANSYSGDYSFMIDIAAEAGIEINLGYFVPVGENPERKLVYFLAYPDKAARDAAWKGFMNDPDWKKKGDSGPPPWKPRREREGLQTNKIPSLISRPSCRAPRRPRPACAHSRPHPAGPARTRPPLSSRTG